MTVADRFTQDLSDCRETSLAGGKAVNLGRLVRAGLPVPNGFVITTRAYHAARGQASNGDSAAAVPSDVAEDICVAYRALGGGVVAVRSSATAEDMAGASMAGQYETILNVEGETAVLQAVQRCWASLDAPRSRAYLREHGLDPAGLAMAVVVQRLVPADVAGVLFTSNPHNGRRREMLIEASWGLGESVVSGRVQPDLLRLEPETGAVVDATIADKHVQLAAGSNGDQAVEESRRRQACLSARDVHQLWQLAKRVVDHFNSPQDIEWAITAGDVYLLQSRPITTLGEAEAYEELLRSTRQHLRQEISAGRGPWVVHNLVETLPHPTPLTWSIIGRFMSGRGGFGAMYRQVGFEPSPAVDRDGFLILIGGRIYMDAARAPHIFFKDYPFAYDIDELKRNPDAAQSPPSLPRGSLRSRLQCAARLASVEARLRITSINLDRMLRDELFSQIAQYVSAAKPTDLQSLPVDRLIALWQEHERQVLDVFAPQLLLPTLISGMAMSDVRTFLQENFWDDDADALAAQLSAGGPPNRTLMADAELYDVGRGNRPLKSWLAEHGHRAAGEFDLAAPRWREQTAAASEMAARLSEGANPLERHRRAVEQVRQRNESLHARLSQSNRDELDRRVDLLRRYIAFREDAKDFLMLGYDLLRDVAIEAGRRLEIGADVFYLTREDLFDALRVGFAPCQLIQDRKAVYRAETRLVAPRVIDAQCIESLGDFFPIAPTSGDLRAMAVSSGEAVGPARIRHSPEETARLGRGYILVRPSTDPAWTPLFANATGLILECGGTLSHGAVVAREMGLPCVVLPDATRMFADGEEIRVDGNRGLVRRVAQADDPSLENAVDPDDTRIAPQLVPPPPGGKDRLAAKIRNRLAILWTVYLLAFFLLPAAWVRQPSLHMIDLLFWPLVRDFGKPATVAMVAAGVAILTLLVQWLATDNRRLRVAKRRAAALKAEAELLSADSPRRAALLRVASTVPPRTFSAAMVPIGILLGPLVLPFVWFQQRVDPSAASPPPGSAVRIVATVESDFSEPVNIDVPAPFTLDETTPAGRTLPPLRKTLENLLTLYRQPRAAPDEPWELRLAPDLGRDQTADDLKAYLDAGIPPQGITWLLRPPDDTAGTFSITVNASGHPPLAIDIVLGDEFPPAHLSVAGGADSPLKEIRVVNPPPKQAPVFWQPFDSLAQYYQFPLSARIAPLDIGWIWLYILVNLLTLLPARALLRIA